LCVRLPPRKFPNGSPSGHELSSGPTTQKIRSPHGRMVDDLGHSARVQLVETLERRRVAKACETLVSHTSTRGTSLHVLMGRPPRPTCPPPSCFHWGGPAALLFEKWERRACGLRICWLKPSTEDRLDPFRTCAYPRGTLKVKVGLLCYRNPCRDPKYRPM